METTDARRDQKIELMNETLIRIDERTKGLLENMRELKSGYVTKEEFAPIKEAHQRGKNLFWAGLASAVGSLVVSIINLFSRHS